MKRTAKRSFVAMALALLGTGGGLQPAVAAEGPHCSITFVLLMDPGLSMEHSTGTHRSEAPAAIDCDGAVNGSPITGPGILTEDGPYGTDDPDSCMAGSEGTGIDRLTIPTRDGPQQIDSLFTYTAGKLSNGGPFRGEFKGSRFSGTIEFKALEGDCVTKPITKLEIKAKGIIHG